VNFGIVYGISPFGLAAQLGYRRRRRAPTSTATFCATLGLGNSLKNAARDQKNRQCAHTFRARAADSDIESRNANSAASPSVPPLTRRCKHRRRPDQAGHDRHRRQLTGRKLKTRMVLQVHDELLFEVHNEETAAIEELVRTGWKA